VSNETDRGGQMRYEAIGIENLGCNKGFILLYWFRSLRIVRCRLLLPGGHSIAFFLAVAFGVFGLGWRSFYKATWLILFFGSLSSKVGLRKKSNKSIFEVC